MGFGDPAGALVGAYVPVDIQHHPRLTVVTVAGQLMPGHRGQQLIGLVLVGEPADLAADSLHLRGPVQSEHSTQRMRVDPGGALRARLAGQAAQHTLDQHRIQTVEPGR